jgi:cbb3-type cytochrome oxidase subunit 1
MPRVSQLFFKTAVIFLIIGIGMGLKMSISGTHNVTGAHAHANLLGWVTMALFGSYYALNPIRAGSKLALVHFGIYTAGVTIMIPALYLMLSGLPSLVPAVAVGSVTAFLGVIVFAAIVFAPVRKRPISIAHPSVAE